MDFKKYIIIIITFCLACTTKKHDSNSLVTIQADPTSAIDLKQSEIFNKIEYIQLESKNGNLIGGIHSLQVINDTFFINDGNHVYLFDKKGNFLNKIGKKGKGPNEYLTLKNFKINPINKTIDIIDINGKKILTYNFNNSHVDNWDIDMYAYDFIKTSSDYLFYCGYEQNEKSKFALNIIKEGKSLIKEKHFPINKNMAWYYYLMQDRYFYTFNDSIFLFRDPFDTIYTYQNERIIPSRVLDFGKYKLPTKFIEKKHDNIFSFSDKADDYSYVHHVNHFIENSSLIYFTFRFKGQKYQVFHKKLNNKTYVAHSIIHDITLNNLKVETNYQEVPRAFSDKALYYIIEPYYFKDKINQIKTNLTSAEWNAYLNNQKEIKFLYNNIKLDNNPIIGVYYLHNESNL